MNTGSESVSMQHPGQHPHEDELERYLLHQLQEEKAEEIETHVLACENCVKTLEELELNIAATKMALSELHQEKVTERVAQEAKASRRWFQLPAVYSLAGAAAALAIALAVAPRFVPAQVALDTYRGTETVAVPQGRPLAVHLNAQNMTPEAVTVKVVSAEGNEVWQGAGHFSGKAVDATLPRLTEKGSYLVQLYRASGNAATPELLREYSISVN